MPRGQEFDPYAELEVSRDASPEVISAAHRALIRRHHPDTAAGRAVAEKAKRLNTARDLLLDPEARERWDQLHGRARRAPARPAKRRAQSDPPAETSPDLGPQADEINASTPRWVWPIVILLIVVALAMIARVPALAAPIAFGLGLLWVLASVAGIFVRR